MYSALPKEGDTYLEEGFVSDLVKMWSEKNQLSEATTTTLRRQLTTLHYDQETIRSWKVMLAQWEALSA